MAKIFYTIEEACAKLSKSEADLMDLIKSGKLREFRDQDQLKLKVEDVHSLFDSGLEMKLDSSIINVSTVSGNLELDLSDSMSPAMASDPNSASPVGMAAPAAIEDELSLEIGSMASGESPALAQDAGADGSDMTLELDFDSSPQIAEPTHAAAPISNAPALDDELTIGLDLDDEPAAAPTPAKSPAAKAPTMASAVPQSNTDELLLDDDLGGNLAPNAPKSAVQPAIQFDEPLADAREDSAIGFGSSADSAIDSAVGLDTNDLTLDQPGSGSGLLDLTQEGDDSQMGAAMMDESFENEDEAPKNASGIFGGATSESEINEAAASGAAAIGSPALAFAGAGMAASEIYDGSWSGLTIGLLVPSLIGLCATAAMLVIKTIGGTPDLAIMFASDWIMWTGAYAGAIAVCGGIGFFVGKATE